MARAFCTAVAEGNATEDEPRLKDPMLAVKDTKAIVKSKIDATTTEVGLLHMDLRKITDRVEQAETTLSALEGEMTALRFVVIILKKENVTVQPKLENAEGRAHCNIFPLLFLKETVEVPRANLFLEDWRNRTRLQRFSSVRFLARRDSEHSLIWSESERQKMRKNQGCKPDKRIECPKVMEELRLTIEVYLWESTGTVDFKLVFWKAYVKVLKGQAPCFASASRKRRWNEMQKGETQLLDLE
ncbi:hypothetical protein NDU88_004103 [Pleurodeles waltl]|uniref:Uncharacterized protein n=1 Tax=Pleurodeles waltl TaxID=8319 RepID=A0AAV7TQW3_PLEWA|nr:hypothetical protein NDU88_004103 [Pleurodeles waltl]